MLCAGGRGGKTERSGGGGEKKRRETEKDKSLPQAHYVICVISEEQRQLTRHMWSMPLPMHDINP